MDALQEVKDACVAAHQDSGCQQGGMFAVVQLDVSKKEQIAAFWEKVPQDLREIDILGTLHRSFSPRFILTSEC